MLILSRYTGQTIEIDGGIEVEVLKISGNQVRLGIRAPKETLVLRGELEKKCVSDTVKPITSTHSEVLKVN